MCQTVKESVKQQQHAATKQSTNSKMENPDQRKPNQTNETKEQQETCPQDCPCRENVKSVKTYLPLLFNVIGILFVMFATYMMITTDSNLYLIFWICYSVLRRMMGKNRTLKMKKD